jgi:hypothetical protein
MSGFRIRVDDTLEEYTAAARRHPVFELQPMTEAPPAAVGGSAARVKTQ